MKEQSLVLALEKLLEDFTKESEILVTDINLRSLITSTNTSKSAVYRLTVTVTSDL